MPEPLLISNLLLWLLLIVMAVALLALARQIGVLHERIRPVGALSLGQAVQAGESAPTFTLPSLNGGVVNIGGEQTQASLLFFLSPNCPVCKTLLPIVRQITTHEDTRLILASDGAGPEHETYIQTHQLTALPYVLSTPLGMAFRIGKLPYAVLIDNAGLVVAHGLINSREHLESLFEARRLGVPTMQALHRATGT